MDMSSGLEYLKKAAELDHGPVAYAVALVYSDVEQCMPWLQKAAELGVAQTALELSGCYLVKSHSNRRLFLIWLKVSTRLGCKEAQTKIADTRSRITYAGKLKASLRKQCGQCGAALDGNTFPQCRNCIDVRYCSTECMVVNGDVHKQHCVEFCKAIKFDERHAMDLDTTNTMTTTCSRSARDASTPSTVVQPARRVTGRLDIVRNVSFWCKRSRRLRLLVLARRWLRGTSTVHQHR